MAVLWQRGGQNLGSIPEPVVARIDDEAARPSAELQAQLKPAALDLAIVKRSLEQLAANQDQLTRMQDQMAQAIAALQAAEQDISQKMSAPPSPAPAPKPVHVSPKQVQPPAQ